MLYRLEGGLCILERGGEQGRHPWYWKDGRGWSRSDGLRALGEAGRLRVLVFSSSGGVPGDVCYSFQTFQTLPIDGVMDSDEGHSEMS